MRLTRFTVALAASFALPRYALAFSEPLLYAEATSTGGGGGRFFTGSPLDSFSCAVCHEGAEAPTVRLKGFPDTFEPGESYDVELEWTQPRRPHALNLEIVDTEGKAAGTIELPEPEDVGSEGKCTYSDDEAQRDQVAASLTQFGSRNIVTVLGCGAASLRFSFTAPNERLIALTASVVRSNQKQDREGDGVYELRRIARRAGEPESRAGSCAAGRPRGLAAPASLLLLASLLALRRRSFTRAPR